MGEELYVNKKGWKCVKSQLQKTDGYDPIEYEQLKKQFVVEDGDQKYIDRKGFDSALAENLKKVA